MSGVGKYQRALLRALVDSPAGYMTAGDMFAVASGDVNGRYPSDIDVSIEALVRRGLIARARGAWWRITAKGRDVLTVAEYARREREQGRSYSYRRVTDHALGPTQREALEIVLLWGPLRPADLQARRRLERSHACRIVARLLEYGLLARRASDKALEITDAGCAAVKAGRFTWERSPSRPRTKRSSGPDITQADAARPRAYVTPRNC